MTEGSGERLAKEVTEIGKKRDRLWLRSGILLDKNPQGSEKVQKRWHFHMNRKLLRFQEVGKRGPGLKAATHERDENSQRK